MTYEAKYKSSVVLVLTFQMSTLFSDHRKISHQTANARTRRQDIMKGIRGDGKALGQRWHFLRDLFSSGIGIETLGRISSFSCWGKALSADLSCLLIFSSPCTNRARSCVCFHDRRSRKTEKDEQNDRWKMLKSDTWGCAKDVARGFGHFLFQLHVTPATYPSTASLTQQDGSTYSFLNK